MKTSIVTGIMFFLTLNIAIGRNHISAPNKELLSTLQHQTIFTHQGKAIQTTTATYLFYSDNTCVVESVPQTIHQNPLEAKRQTLRWMRIGNHIILLDKCGKQVGAFSSKGDINSLFKGQKTIASIQEIDKQEYLSESGEQLALIP